MALPFTEEILSSEFLWNFGREADGGPELAFVAAHDSLRYAGGWAWRHPWSFWYRRRIRAVVGDGEGREYANEI